MLPLFVLLYFLFVLLYFPFVLLEHYFLNSMYLLQTVLDTYCHKPLSEYKYAFAYYTFFLIPLLQTESLSFHFSFYLLILLSHHETHQEYVYPLFSSIERNHYHLTLLLQFSFRSQLLISDFLYKQLP